MLDVNTSIIVLDFAEIFWFSLHKIWVPARMQTPQRHKQENNFSEGRHHHAGDTNAKFSLSHFQLLKCRVKWKICTGGSSGQDPGAGCTSRRAWTLQKSVTALQDPPILRRDCQVWDWKLGEKNPKRFMGEVFLQVFAYFLVALQGEPAFLCVMCSHPQNYEHHFYISDQSILWLSRTCPDWEPDS